MAKPVAVHGATQTPAKGTGRGNYGASGSIYRK